MLVVLDADNHMYLGRGWEHFAYARDLQLGHFLVFRYDSYTVLPMKVSTGPCAAGTTITTTMPVRSASLLPLLLVS